MTPEIDLQKSTRENDKKFLIPGYAASKLRAERVVLNSSGAKLNNGKGKTCNSFYAGVCTFQQGYQGTSSSSRSWVNASFEDIVLYPFRDSRPETFL